MTVIRRVLSKVGIGSIEVDTILEKEDIVVGEEIKGIIKIKGTSIKQTIDGIHLTLSIKFASNLRKRNLYTRFDLHRVKIADKFTLLANETKDIPFSFIVPNDTPITLDNNYIWVHTNLNIKNAKDPVDIDYITVHPNLKMKSIIENIESTGFSMQKVEICESPKQYKFRLPFVQEVTFVPTGENKIDKLKMIPLYNEEFSLELMNDNGKSKQRIISEKNVDMKTDIMKLLEGDL